MNIIGTEGNVYKRTFYNSIIKSVNRKGSATAIYIIGVKHNAKIYKTQSRR